MCRVCRRYPPIDVRAPRAVGLLYAHQPVTCSPRRVQRPPLLRRFVPGGQTVDDLRGVERGRSRRILVHFAAGKAAVCELEPQQEIERASGPISEAAESRLFLEGEERRNDVPGRFGIGRCPPRTQQVTATDTAVLLNILRACQPRGRRFQVVAV